VWINLKGVEDGLTRGLKVGKRAFGPQVQDKWRVTADGLEAMLRNDVPYI
jgi:hypothetical protein